MRTFPIWKTATLGTFRTTNAIRRALITGGYYRYIDAEDEDREYEYRSARTTEETNEIFEGILTRTPLAARRTEVDLVRATLPQLGFDGPIDHGAYLAGPQFHEIADRAWMRGWRLCPAEVGLQLRLQHARQPLGEVINVGMEPILIPGYGYPYSYMVFHDSCGRFVAENEMKYGELSPERFWVFVKPRAP